MSTTLGDQLIQQAFGPPPVFPFTGQTTQAPSWSRMNPTQLYSTDMGPVGNYISQLESGRRNQRELVRNPDTGQMEPTGKASGFLQIEDPTWNDTAPAAGVSLSRWPTAMDAPPQVQWAVAQDLPLSRWGPRTVDAVLKQYPWATRDMTLRRLNEIEASHSGIRQQYIPAAQTSEFNARRPSEWGRPPAGGYEHGPGNLPGVYDVPPLMRGLAIAVPILSLFTRGAAIPLLTAYGGFVEGYQNGQILKQKLAQNQWRNSLAETVARMEQEGIEAGDAFEAMGNNEAGLRDALGGIATRYGDDAMRAALANGGPAAVEKLLQRRDTQYTDLNKTKRAQELEELRIQRLREQIERDRQLAGRRAEAAQTTEELRRLQIDLTQARTRALETKSAADAKKRDDLQKKVEERKERLRRLGVPDASIPSDTQIAGDETTPTPAEEDDTTTTTAVPEETPEPTESDQGAAAAPASPSRAEAPGAIRSAVQPAPAPVEEEVPQRTQVASLAPVSIPTQRRPAPPPVTQVAEKEETPVDTWSDQLLTGDTPANLQGVDKDALPYIQELAARKRARLNRVMATPDLTGADLVQRVREVSPGSADTLQGMLERRAGAPETISSPRMAQYWNTMESLARKADPTWDPGQYRAVDQFRNPNGRTQYALGRVSALATNAALVLQDLKNLPDDKDALTRAIKAWNAGTLEGSSIYTNLFVDWQAFAIESNVVRSGGGGSVTETEQIIRAIPNYGSKEQFRGAVKHDSITAGARIEHWRNQWRQLGRRDVMAGDEPEATRTLQWIKTLDERTGRMTGPGEVPGDLVEAMPPDIKGFDPKKPLTGP